jgi:hypothetical protein
VIHLVAHADLEDAEHVLGQPALQSVRGEGPQPTAISARANSSTTNSDPCRPPQSQASKSVWYAARGRADRWICASLPCGSHGCPGAKRQVAGADLPARSHPVSPDFDRADSAYPETRCACRPSARRVYVEGGKRRAGTRRKERDVRPRDQRWLVVAALFTMTFAWRIPSPPSGSSSDPGSGIRLEPWSHLRGLLDQPRSRGAFGFAVGTRRSLRAPGAPGRNRRLAGWALPRLDDSRVVALLPVRGRHGWRACRPSTS